MTGLFSKLFGRKDPAIADATRIYNRLMMQARHAQFFGVNKVTDSYDGRIDLLTLHIAPIMYRLQALGNQGQFLSQALYDVMRDDFEIALREEGMSDTGVKKRIKPIMNLFFTQVKAYVGHLEASEALMPSFKPSLLEDPESTFAAALSAYISEFNAGLEGKTLGQIAHADFTFPIKPS